MTTEHLTANQRLAIETLDRACLVTAGPGAGKTRVLVERVLNILQRGMADLDEIVAITFTNKAANEMKERIRRTLIDLAAAATEAGEKRRWVEMKRRLEDAAISTIHGFCASVLRAQPVEARVDPQVAILDEYVSQLLLLEAAEEVVSELADESDGVAAQLIMGYTRRGLINAVAGLYTAMRTLGLSLNQVEQLTLGNLSTAEDYRHAVASLQASISELNGLSELSPRAREQVEKLVETWTRYRSRLPIEPRVEEVSSFNEWFEALIGCKVYKSGKIKEWATAWSEQLEDLELIFYDACGRESVRTLMGALSRLDARYQAAKAERNGLDYEDLQLKVRDLFRSHPWLAQQYADRVRFILVDEFQDTNGLQKEILDLLTAGRRSSANDQPPATDTGHRRPNLFIVADNKQSIYNFRGAAVEVLVEAARELEAQGAAAIVLEKNFRSTASLIRFFNQFFSRLMILEPGQDVSLMQPLGYVEFMPGQPHRGASPHAPVELVLEIGEHVKNAGEGRELEAARLAERIAEMVQTEECLVAEGTHDGEERWRPVRYGDIAILFRAMTDIKLYERALRKRGIPYYVLAGRGFYQREEIQDMICLLRFLENRTDEIALVSALRSPLFGLSDETLYWLRQHADISSSEADKHHPLLSSLLDPQSLSELSAGQRPLAARAAEILSHLLDQRNRVPLADLLEDILTITSYEAIQATFYDGHQRVANLRKLVELARGYEERGPHFLPDFIQFVAQFAEVETPESEAPVEMGGDDVVHIMTIHKAKGLEFPVVIIPDLARQFKSQVPNLTFDRGLGLGMKVPDQRGRLHESMMHKRVAEQIEWRNFFENQRLLFVAATRAKDTLILAGTASRLGREGKANRDKQRRPFIASRSGLQQATSWLEWLCAILGIDDPQSLPQVYEWNGVRLRVSSKGLTTAAARRPIQRIVDRVAETRRGEPIPAGRLPQLTGEDQQALQSVAQRVNPVVVEPTTSPRPLAVTRLLSFARCPLQYYYENVLGLPESDQYEESGPFVDAFTASSGLSAAARGILMHRFCELYDGAEEWETLLRRLVNEQVVTVETGDVESARARALADVKPLAEHYLNSELWQEMERIIWGSAPGRVQSEVDFIYHTGAMPVRGRIDKLIIDGEDRATIIDFKTNRITPEQVEEVATEYELQMQTYALAGRRALGLKRVRAELYFLEPDVRFEIDPQHLDEARTAREIEELCQHILKLRQYQDAAARPSPGRCHRCRCFSFCPSRAV